MPPRPRCLGCSAARTRSATRGLPLAMLVRQRGVDCKCCRWVLRRPSRPATALALAWRPTTGSSCPSPSASSRAPTPTLSPRSQPPPSLAQPPSTSSSPGPLSRTSARPSTGKSSWSPPPGRAPPLLLPDSPSPTLRPPQPRTRRPGGWSWGTLRLWSGILCASAAVSRSRRHTRGRTWRRGPQARRWLGWLLLRGGPDVFIGRLQMASTNTSQSLPAQPT
mmetsp:Transcript_48575/g.105816  ORF Transcript_48575/g.105816 Transcript_48575/m.105816 type:complete len:221 (+) Transcript_48575:877-1539(+)